MRMHAREITRLRHGRAVVSIFFGQGSKRRACAVEASFQRRFALKGGFLHSFCLKLEYSQRIFAEFVQGFGMSQHEDSKC